MEIERKYKLTALPPVELLGPGQAITQIYLATEPLEIRLRRKGGKTILTAKSNGTIARDEWETTVPDWLFAAAEVGAARIDKTRYCIEHDGRTLEVDEFHGPHHGLVLLECEFVDLADADYFQLPAWAADATEVTTDPAYKNKNLVR